MGAERGLIDRREHGLRIGALLQRAEDILVPCAFRLRQVMDDRLHTLIVRTEVFDVALRTALTDITDRALGRVERVVSSAGRARL